MKRTWIFIALSLVPLLAHADRPCLYALPLQRWNSLDSSGVTTKSYALAEQLVDTLATYPELDLCGIHIGLHGKWDYMIFDQSNPGYAKSALLRGLTEDLFSRIEGYGLQPVTSGPGFAKGINALESVGLPVNAGDVEYHYAYAFNVTDNKGYAELTALTAELKKVPLYTVAKITVSSRGGGTIYLNNSSGGHITKSALPGGTAVTHEITFINLPGIDFDVAFYRGSPKDLCLTKQVIWNKLDSSEVVVQDGQTYWTGDAGSGFFRGRTVDLTNDSRLWDICYDSAELLPDVQLLCLTDELNSPLGYGSRFQQMYPSGWPQAWALLISRFSNVIYHETGRMPWMFQTDPRPDPEELRHNRTCAPVPDFASPDYLTYMDSSTPMVLCIWTETLGSPREVDTWKKVIAQSDRFPHRMICIGSTQANVDSVFAAIGPDRVGLFDYGVFWWDKQQYDAIPTLLKVQENIERYYHE